MNELSRYLAVELPKIEDFIGSEIDKLDLLVRPVAAHVLSAGGKRLRPLLTILTARAFGQTGDAIYPLACSLEFLHSATLLHDDILDCAELRRGKPAAHTLFSRSQTILTGDVLLALANILVSRYGIPRLVEVLSDAIMKTVVGEVAEIASTGKERLSRAEYMDILTGKTAYLIQAACQCGAILAGATEEDLKLAGDFGVNLGIAFQLVDDALDYSSDSAVSGKPAGADLREGKLTLPLILLLEEMDVAQGDELLGKIKKRSLNPDEVDRVLEMVRERELPEKTRQVASEYMDRSQRALAAFPDTLERQLLAQSVDYVLTRNK